MDIILQNDELIVQTFVNKKIFIQKNCDDGLMYLVIENLRHIQWEVNQLA